MAYFVLHRMERLANSSTKSDDLVIIRSMDQSAIWRYVTLHCLLFLFIFIKFFCQIRVTKSLAAINFCCTLIISFQC